MCQQKKNLIRHFELNSLNDNRLSALGDNRHGNAIKEILGSVLHEIIGRLLGSTIIILPNAMRKIIQRTGMLNLQNINR